MNEKVGVHHTNLAMLQRLWRIIDHCSMVSTLVRLILYSSSMEDTLLMKISEFIDKCLKFIGTLTIDI